jgi:hypothetical protein
MANDGLTYRIILLQRTMIIVVILIFYFALALCNFDGEIRNLILRASICCIGIIGILYTAWGADVSSQVPAGRGRLVTLYRKWFAHNRKFAALLAIFAATLTLYVFLIS